MYVVDGPFKVTPIQVTVNIVLCINGLGFRRLTLALVGSCSKSCFQWNSE